MCCFIQQSSNQIDTEVLEGTGCQVNTIGPETKKKKKADTDHEQRAGWVNQSIKRRIVADVYEAEQAPG